MKKILVLSLLLFCFAVYAKQETIFLGIEIQGAGTFELKALPNSKQFFTNHSIDGYAVNCKKSKLVLWGTPISLSAESPQRGAITIVDITTKKIIRTIKTERGVMNVDYLKGGAVAKVLMGYGTVVNLHTGVLRYLTMDEENELVFEFCPNFKGKTFQK